MAVRIWGMIQVIERSSERDGVVIPTFQGTVCIGQVGRSSRHQIAHSQFLKEVRWTRSDAVIRNGIFTGDERVMTAAMNAAVSVCQVELLISFREIQHNLEEMRLFMSELGHETSVHPKVVLAGAGEDRWEVESEDELLWAAPQFLPSQRVVGWLKEELERHDPRAAHRL